MSKLYTGVLIGAMSGPDYNEIDDLCMGQRPHVVILGAGASRNAFPDGDKNGRSVPLMDDLIEVTGLASILRDAGIEYSGRNFEEVYSSVHETGDASTLEIIERHIDQYFSALQLPDEPTLYDHLVLSLREKDLIATFNWDPFLFLAFRRNRFRASLPKSAFLHGNVAIGHCVNDWIAGPRGTRCWKCRELYTDSKLLYPILKKHYSENSFIGAEWSLLRSYLANAFVLTIFGYSAPDSDVEAISLMKGAWGPAEGREFEETEIIDKKIGTKEEDEFLATWRPFILETHHVEFNNFHDSFTARHPRRTCEAMRAQVIEKEFLDDREIPQKANWRELTEWFRPLVLAEGREGT